jgi:DHA2 family multidrug resistance protein-like MFS transporter
MLTRRPAPYRGDDKLLFGIILGVLAFWLFAQTTLNIAPTMAADLEVTTNVMNIAVSITALFSGIFIVVVGGLADRVGRAKILMWGFILGIIGSFLVALAPAGPMAVPWLMLVGQYTILAAAAYTLFGLGLAFYATPSTDAALSNLPDDQAGSGSGIYKMASSLGASFGVAISAAVFTALSAGTESTRWLDGVITFAGRQDNVAVRQAALIALAFNLLIVVAAIVSIMLTVPKGLKSGESR